MALQTKEFTTVTATEDNTFTFVARVTENSIDIAANSSNVTVEFILRQANSGVCFQNMMTAITLELMGKPFFSDTCRRSLVGTEEHLFYTWTGDVSHEVDGKLDLLLTARVWLTGLNSHPMPQLQINKVEMALTTIPKNSGVGAADGAIGTNTTIVLIPAVSGASHSLRFTFGELQGFIGPDGSISEREKKFTATVISFPIPEEFYTQIPDKPWDWCNLQINSYWNNTLLGTGKAKFRAIADPALCGPLLQASVADENPDSLAATGDENVLVCFCSDARCQAEAQGQKSAAITGVTVNGRPVDGVLTIPAAETGRYTFVATDSRGYQKELVVEKTLIPYIALTCNPEVCRTAPTTGQAELTVRGNCWNGNFGQADNTLAGRYRVNGGAWVEFSAPVQQDHTYQVTHSLEGLDYTRLHLVEVEMTDLLQTVSASTIVQRGIPVFDWGEDYFNFHVPVHFGAGVTGLT